MAKSLYLINPKNTSPSYFGSEVYEFMGLPPIQAVADLATVTVAAMAPKDWHIEICEEHIEPINFDVDADFIGITGKITQEKHMLLAADEFRRRGKTVIIGGPYASLSPHIMRGHCDILVIGEMESIAEEFFQDLENGTWKAEYECPQPDLSTSPLPRWELYPNDRALMGCVQTSRGCPFECDFCDVIQYLGRKQRHKPVEMVIAELDQLYDLGYNSCFLADDNFTVYRKRAKELMEALKEWNLSRPNGPMSFSTQVSIDAARDPEIMRLMAECGMTSVFVGIETPNMEALKETKKRQNVGVDLVRQVEIFFEHGIVVLGGMIVGFDADGTDIFERQHEFAMQSGIPVFSLNPLVALSSTPLYARLRDEGRLVASDSEVSDSILTTNFVPTQMTNEQLGEGMAWLCNVLYQPDCFADRVETMLETLGPPRGAFALERGDARIPMSREVDRMGVNVLKKLIRQGPAERKMWSRLRKMMAAQPGSEGAVIRSLMRYAQVRCLYETQEFFEPIPAGTLPFQGVVPEGSTAKEGGSLVQIGGA